MSITKKVKKILGLPTATTVTQSTPVEQKKYRNLNKYVHTENQDFDFEEITLDQIKDLEQKVYDRMQIGMFGYGIKSTKPEAFNEEYYPAWDRIVEIHQKHREKIREFEFAFLGQDPRGQALANFSFITLTISLRGKYINDELLHSKKVYLRSSGCSPSTFELFCKIAIKCLGLKPRLPAEPSESDKFYSKWKNASNNPELLDLIEATVKATKYDLAIKAAVGMVESKLRERCISMGRLEAAHQVGSDLAVTAFHKDTGCLTPPWPIATEALHGTFLIFSGFFLYLRNAYAHHTIVMGTDTTTVLECLLTCEFLLKIIDKSSPRGSPVSKLRSPVQP